MIVLASEEPFMNFYLINLLKRFDINIKTVSNNSLYHKINVDPKHRYIIFKRTKLNYYE